MTSPLGRKSNNLVQNQDAKVMDELLANVLSDSYYHKLQRKEMRSGTITGNDQSNLLSNKTMPIPEGKLTQDEIRKLLDEMAVPLLKEQLNKTKGLL